MDIESGRKIEIFCSYSHKDKVLTEELVKQLRRNHIVWHDRKIMPGGDWAKEIDSHLKTADIILLLVSPDFMNSDYCYGIEMQCAMERLKNQEAEIIPIILRPTYWEDSIFGHLQALPTGALSVVEWKIRDKAFRDIAMGVGRVINGKLKESFVVEARKHSEDEKYSETIQAYKNALRLFPRDATLYKDMADTLYKIGDLQSALDAYAKAIENDDQNAQLYLSKGNLLFELKDFRGAFDIYKKALEFDSNNSFLYEKKGDAAFNLGLSYSKEAEEAYNKSIELKPGNDIVASLWNKKADIYIGLYKSKEEKNNIINAHDTSYKIMLEWYNECKLKGDMENLSYAKQFLMSSMRTKGNRLVEIGDLNEALKAYDEALKWGNNGYYLYIDKGDVLYEINRFREAYLVYDGIIKNLEASDEIVTLAKERVEKVIKYFEDIERQKRKIFACGEFETEEE